MYRLSAQETSGVEVIEPNALNEWAVLLAPILIGALLIAWHRRRVPERIDAWAGVRDLELTAENRDLVRRYLLRTRTLRTIGGFAGVVVNLAVITIYNLTLSDWWFDNVVERFNGVGWALVFLGYLIGALVAEVTLDRPEGAGRAAVVARDVRDYVAPYTRVALRWLVVAVVALVAVTELAVDDAPGFGIAAVVLAVIGLALVEGLQNWIVQRRQALASADLIEADDAVRAASVQAATGAGMGLLLSLVGGQLANLAVPLDGILGTLAGIAGGVIAILALPIWLGYGTDHMWAPPSRVRRNDEVAA